MLKEVRLKSQGWNVFPHVQKLEREKRNRRESREDRKDIKGRERKGKN